MARRYSKWFTILSGGSYPGPGQAKYNGRDSNGVSDPIKEGQVGRTYSVWLYSATKLEAPNPPFETDEGFVIRRQDTKQALEFYIKKYKIEKK